MGTIRLYVGNCGVGKSFGRVLDVCLEALLLQHRSDDFRALFWFVPAPAAPND